MRPETSCWHPYSDMGSVRHSDQTAIARSVVRLVEAAEQSLREGGQEIAVEQNLRENHLVAASGWAVL